MTVTLHFESAVLLVLMPNAKRERDALRPINDYNRTKLPSATPNGMRVSGFVFVSDYAHRCQSQGPRPILKIN